MTSEGERDCGIPEPHSLRSSPEHGASPIASEHKRYRRTTPTALTRILRLARGGETGSSRSRWEHQRDRERSIPMLLPGWSSVQTDVRRESLGARTPSRSEERRVGKEWWYWRGLYTLSAEFMR